MKSDSKVCYNATHDSFKINADIFNSPIIKES